MRINIVSQNNGVGLTQDIKIITDLLAKEGHRVTFSHTSTQPLAKYDLNIFVEHVVPNWLNASLKNVLIPNPEWYDRGWEQYLSYFDMIIVKTKHAENIFRKRGLRS